jgi:hypothetical protein
MTRGTDRPRPYWDEVRQKWMVDDYGRPREATPEEIEAMQKEDRR